MLKTNEFKKDMKLKYKATEIRYEEKKVKRTEDDLSTSKVSQVGRSYC